MKKFKQIFFTCLLFTLAFSCSTDDSSDDSDPEKFDGSTKALEDFFSPELVTSLKNLGFVINEGANPPNIEGTYFSSPFILQGTTVPGESIGKSFADYTSTFSNQDNNELTIDFNGSGGSQVDVGYGSFVAGNDNNFSVYLKNTTQIGTYTAETAFAISGIITETGIKNYQFALMMLDDKGDIESVYIENNTGRLIHDSDYFSEKIE
ncbi:hypothetical protein [Algibacter sp. PT7-4]|uniref:hypothetical protein n=1 Tax=Algibacter ulvanivorans TaxID=3400999 RepID=UPI003AB05D89